LAQATPEEEEDMYGTRGGIFTALCGMIALALAVGSADAAGSRRDRAWCDPALSEHPLSTIAILPVVSVTGDERAESWVENGWTLFYDQAKTNWVSAADVRGRIPEARLAAVRDEVWHQGRPSAQAAVDLARSLAVDAVLSVRVDRWEIADGGRAMVELSAVLTAADGSCLWSISGLAGHGRAPGSRDRNFSGDMTWFWRPELQPREPQDPLGLAMCTLFARWAVALPGAIIPVANAPVQLLAEEGE
jgi:hypothetical protein